MDKNLNDIMKQAQAVQSKLQEAQKNIENLRVTGTSGAGVIEVIMTGRHEVTEIKIDDSLVKK